MQTRLDPQFQHTAEGLEAEQILRNCVHCGFCTATCPTYQLTGDELDSPRGRIYLLKQLLEGNEVSANSQHHLDRCLTCRACETTCPSGVRYGRLADIGRHLIEQRVQRTRIDTFKRWIVRKLIPYPKRFGFLLRLGQWFRPVLPSAIRAKVPPPQKAGVWPTARHSRTMVALGGCVQSSATPVTNAAAARVLDKIGIQLIEVNQSGCCGAVDYHLSAHSTAMSRIKATIDTCWPAIEAGAEAILMTASGCGLMVRDYAELLKDDPDYAHKAKKLSDITRDLSEVLASEDLSALGKGKGRVAWHSPCTLQHGQQITGQVERILSRCGFELTDVADSHLCCGSAGTYSLLQPDLSNKLLKRKLASLEKGKPEVIVSANIGCQMHLGSASSIPVRHWIELLDDLLDDT